MNVQKLNLKTIGQFSIGDIVAIEPFGDSPTHYCRIEYFGIWVDWHRKPFFAMGRWYAKTGNGIDDTGFNVDYIRKADEKDLKEAMEKHQKMYPERVIYQSHPAIKGEVAV